MMRDRLPLILGALALIGLAAGLTALDAAVDAGSEVLPEVALDFLDRIVTLGAVFFAVWLALRLSHLRNRTDDLEGAVGRAADEGRAWRAQSRRFTEGLGRAIDAQFDAWHLTPAEADVAGLLLKGASLREIATLRRTAEATIRQQAQTVYRKSGLSNRSELAAYFLEDLFTLGEASLAEPPPGPRFDA